MSLSIHFCLALNMDALSGLNPLQKNISVTIILPSDPHLDILFSMSKLLG